MTDTQNVSLTGVERTFGRDEIIVSKTNTKGHIEYGNQLFYNLAGYPEKDLIGAPHSIVRHPHMPRCIFKLLWDTIEAKKEIFAFVMNRSANGDHYWVLAHATPSLDPSGNILGYHSNRRVADRRVLNETIIPLYKNLLAEENKYGNRKDGMNASYGMLVELLKQKGVKYDELVFSLLRAA